MKPWYNQNDCENLAAYHAYYPVPAAAMLWCKVPPDEVQEELNRISPHPHIRGVFTHPFIPCFEARCRVLQDAITSGALPASRENGVVTTDHIAPERRHISREHLKTWIAKEHPSDKPAFLFDEIERSTHANINAATYMVLHADRDGLRDELKRVRARAESQLHEMEAMRGELDSLRAMVDRQTVLKPRAEATYLNIIGGLLGLMLGTTPGGQKGSAYETQAAIISALLAYHGGKYGIADSTLEQKFAEARRSINAT